VAVVHNGIIENHLELKETLTQAGKVLSETDTEIFATSCDEEKSGKALPDASAGACQGEGHLRAAVMSERSRRCWWSRRTLPGAGPGRQCNFVRHQHLRRTLVITASA